MTTLPCDDDQDRTSTPQQNRDAGIAAAEAGAGDWWVSCARQAFLAAARDSYATSRVFTTYEVGERYGVPRPAERRAWGAIAKWAKAQGIVVCHGYTGSKDPEGHAQAVIEWRGTARTNDPVDVAPAAVRHRVPRPTTRTGRPVPQPREEPAETDEAGTPVLFGDLIRTVARSTSGAYSR